MSRERFLEFIRNTDARTDPNFASYGVRTDSLNRLITPNDRPLLAIGLKGVGKTAGFKLLSSAGGADIIRSINAESLQVIEGARQKPTLQYVPEVRGELLLQAISDLAEKADRDPAFARQVPQHIHQNARQLREQVWERLKALGDEIGGISILGFGVTRRASTKKADKAFKLVTSSEHEKAIELINSLRGKVTFRVIIDDPETIFTIDEGLNLNMIAAVCIVSNELNVLCPNFRTIVLIKPNILDALVRVDEFVNIPLDRRVKLSWSRNELKEVVTKRAKTAAFDLAEIFRPSPEVVLDRIVSDSRTGPRDVLNRLLTYVSLHPNRVVDLEGLEDSSEQFADACYEQMIGAYERQYRGLCRASLILFEGDEKVMDKTKVELRFDQMIASNIEFIGFKDEEWARSSDKFLGLLIQFGLVAIRVGEDTVLPYESNYYDAAKRSDALYTFLPGLRAKVKGRAADSPKAKAATPRS